MYAFPGFIFLFLTIQNIAMYFEAEGYPQFISDIQGERSSMIPKGIPTTKVLAAYFLIYLCVLTLFYTFILKRNGSLSEAFLLGSAIYAVVDVFLYGIFKRTNFNHIPTLLYDVFIVGGLSFALSLYLFKEYPKVISNYTPFLIISFLITLIAGIHKIYRFEQTP